jgi:secondary thiamine-phosphate synthase enzyme
MKTITKYLTFHTEERFKLINITPDIVKVVEESNVSEGICLVNSMHITSSIFINDDESGLHLDFEKWLQKLAPHLPTKQYLHNDTGEDNADSHLKRQIMGRETVVAITGGKLDGCRSKKVLVKVIGE